MSATLLLALGIPAISQAADEAERQVWLFRNNGEAQAWKGNGPLPHGAWPVRDKCLQLTASAKGNPSISKQELMLPAEQVNVVQIQMDASPAKKCRLFFATDVSPRVNAQKLVEFDLKPDVREYTLDLKALPAWNNQVTVLRFDFLGLKEDDTISIKCIKVFIGEKISTPMVYTAYRPGEKQVVKEFRAASLFNSNMVLQRDKPLPVWGCAKPGASVAVRFAGQTRNATTDSNGKWSATLDAVPANAEPQTMEIVQATETLSFTNVVVGDVWLCGGQSNMGGAPQDNAPPAERRKELLETDYPNFRYVSMPSLHRETPLPNDAMEEALTWNSIRASALRGVSAVSYYFGQTVHTTQKIPVGLVFVIKAGSQVEQWIGVDELRRVFPGDELQKVAGRRLASGLHNGMIAPIAPFPLRGAMWYQGESNADDEFKYMGYYRSLPALIREWRRLWGADLPVMLAQLPAYTGYPTNSWAHIREAQLLTSQRLPNVGLAVTFDEGDPTNLHPANKYFIGTRLGLAARAMVYGEKLECSGPVYSKLERQKNTLTLRFTHVAGGLKARGELAGFEVRGADQTWVPATAAITGKDGLTVSSPIVSEPQAARYAWKNNPVSTLFNDIALPASPFRTDTPVETQPLRATPPSPVWLSSLELPSIPQEWGNGTPRADKATDGTPLTIAGKKFERGIGAHAPYTMFVELGGAGNAFSASVGVDDGAAKKAITSRNPMFGGGAFNDNNFAKAKHHIAVSFQVYGDGRQLFDSGTMKPGDPAKPVELNLTGVKVLELVVSNHGFYPWALADWAGAKLEMAGSAKPRIVPDREVDGEPEILMPPVPDTPRINGPKVFGVRPGSPFFYTIPATGTRPIEFAAEGLPTGLKLDTNSGVISGVIAACGEHTVNLRVKNSKGATARPFKIVCGDGLALTPPMGWNSWQLYAGHISQEKILRQANALVKSGLRDHGYAYVNIDNGWTATRGGPLNAIQPDMKNFPDMKACVDEIHRLGLRAGIYSSPWISGYGNTCGDTSDNPDGRWDAEQNKKDQGQCGKFSFATNDVRQWVAWEFDLMKYDWHPMDLEHTRLMSEALRTAPRDIVFTISNTGFVKDAPGYVKYTHFWRTGGDNLDVWRKVDPVFDTADEWAPFARPGHWNDPDMLLVGTLAWGNEKAARPTRLTPNEQYAHISFWCLSANPLLLSCDLEKLDAFTLNLLTNDEVLEVNQDPIGKAARRIAKDGDREVWAKPLEDGSWAAGLFNRGRVPATVTIRWSDLKLQGQRRVRDLWRQTDVGTFDETFSAEVPRHGVRLLRLFPAHVARIQPNLSCRGAEEKRER
jgi:alpha-galactosidase